MSDRSKAPEPSCPICGKSQDARYRPFCSRRCADIDLTRWLPGRYASPATEQEGPGEEGGAEGDAEDAGKGGKAGD